MTVSITQTEARPEHGPERSWHDRRDLSGAGTRPRPSASVADVVMAYLRTQVASLRSLEPKVRADEFDAVHQMRVTTRGLRGTLRSFGMVIPRARTGKLR